LDDNFFPALMSIRKTLGFHLELILSNCSFRLLKSSKYTLKSSQIHSVTSHTALDKNRAGMITLACRGGGRARFQGEVDFFVGEVVLGFELRASFLLGRHSTT
jgi:hypothetical protein